MVRELESILHNEIPVLVHNKVVQTITLDQFLKDLAQVLWLGLLNRSIDYIRRALLHAKLINLAKKLGNDFLAYFFIPKLKCLLNSVIAVRILRQLNSMGYELLHEADSVLLESGLRNYKLHHAQSMIVHWKLNEAIEDLVKHKLSLGLFKALHQDLYNMGALHIQW